MTEPGIVVHGGAGEVTRDRHGRLREGVRAAAEAGHAVLAAGGTALDAVVVAVRVLEDDPEFNAGVGSALTRDGTVETDASVMDGATQQFGGVAAVPDLGVAIALARAVLDSEHVLLAGPAALRFAAEHGIAPAPAGALVTQRARAHWREAAAKRDVLSPERTGPRSGHDSGGGPERAGPRSGHDPKASGGGPERTGPRSGHDPKASGGSNDGGTVGAVARDRDGHFAAATSTGGVVWKRAGRVGDSPIPGAGTWADRAIAISATGDGEAILRVALARGVAAQRAAGRTLRDAALTALRELRDVTGGGAGLIAIDASDFVAIQLTPTMSTAWICGSERGNSLGERVPQDRT